MSGRPTGKLLLLIGAVLVVARGGGTRCPHVTPPTCASASPHHQPLAKTKDVIAALPASLRAGRCRTPTRCGGRCSAARMLAWGLQGLLHRCTLTPAWPAHNPGGKSSPLPMPSPAGELGSAAAPVKHKTQRTTTAFAWFSENPHRGYAAARCKFIERCIWRLKHQQRFNFLKRLLLLR